MGTRSLTYVLRQDGTILACLYRHFDGYLEGHGEDLLQFLEGYEITNGLPLEPTGKRANGPDELAALLVWHFKGAHPRGNIYLYPPTFPQDAWQEVEYFLVCPAEGKPSLFYREGFGDAWGELRPLQGPMPLEEAQALLDRVWERWGQREAV